MSAIGCDKRNEVKNIWIKKQQQNINIGHDAITFIDKTLRMLTLTIIKKKGDCLNTMTHNAYNYVFNTSYS